MFSSLHDSRTEFKLYTELSSIKQNVLLFSFVQAIQIFINERYTFKLMSVLSPTCPHNGI